METLNMIIACLIILMIQLLFCFKANKLWIKLVPAIVIAIALAVSFILMLTATGWDSLMYIVFVMLFGALLLSCIAGFAIWAIYSYLKKN